MDAVLLLISFGADVNAIADARNDYRTVMHYAVLSGKALVRQKRRKTKTTHWYESVRLAFELTPPAILAI